MCGIVAFLRSGEGAGPNEGPAARDLRQRIAATSAALASGGIDGASSASLVEAAVALDEITKELANARGVRLLVRQPRLRRELLEYVAAIESELGRWDEALESESSLTSGGGLEAWNAALVKLRDACWSLRHDRIGHAAAVEALGVGTGSDNRIDGLSALEVVLSALDRLEVRGRDSAGLVLNLPIDDDLLRGKLFEGRDQDPLLLDRALRLAPGSLSFTYKAAAEIGELGDNGRRLRAAIRKDKLLHEVLDQRGCDAMVLGHTRWASVGMISEANAHPLDEQELKTAKGPSVFAALNGDVDNYADLKAAAELGLADEITTDAKIIPVLVSRALAEGDPLDAAFRDTVSSFKGSVAIAAMSAAERDRLCLALRGSGQALYVGLAEDAFIVASEPYGVVELTSSYFRLDGETPGNPANPDASRGQVVLLDRRAAGRLEGIQRWAYDGTELPLSPAELKEADITTRDVDRGHFSHFLLKEISESPTSFRKTLRGKLQTQGPVPQVLLGTETLPSELVVRLESGDIRRILFIGQGTAAVAGQGVARTLKRLVSPMLPIEAIPATELSGFELADDMRDTLVVAISQSGTTTDTNRTVDLVRARGAFVVAIVNRRNSDLTDKADGVLYTSDGRDVEMSVASTKAFYSQIAAGCLLAVAIVDLLPSHCVRDAQGAKDLLLALAEMPNALQETLELSDKIKAIAERHASRHRYWALVGNGSNRPAAEEIRIKLSELCYKSIACDATEDKKHIDLSSEPLLLICAAGLQGSTADDVAKEVAIYRAHKATPIVIASRGEHRYAAAVELIEVPTTRPQLAFVLSVMAGHLFGYYAALAIDGTARPLREVRALIESASNRALKEKRSGAQLLEELRERSKPPVEEFLHGLYDGRYDGHLEASTASRLSSLIRLLESKAPLDAFAARHGRPATPSAFVEELTERLTEAIDQLTRPVDAIKHQAKTVTVGISRTDEALLTVGLVRQLLDTGIVRDRIGYDDLRALAAMDPVVERVLGFTRYRLEGNPERDDSSLEVVAMSGIARDIGSRTTRNPLLRGTKRRVARDRKLLVARGSSDNRTFVLVPEIEQGIVQGLTLMHLQFVDRASQDVLRGLLRAYRGRYSSLRDAVMETEPTFREDLLETVDVIDLLSDSVDRLAAHWRS